MLTIVHSTSGDHIALLGSTRQDITPAERRRIWSHYESWVREATDDELEQLQQTLEQFDSDDVTSLACLVHNALDDAALAAKFPASFFEQLRVPYRPELRLIVNH